MKKWIINYYNKRLFQDIFSMPKEILASYVAISDTMEMHGPNIGMPHTRAMGEGLFEIRASGKEGIGRVFYCTANKNEIWMLHSIIKKHSRRLIRH